MRAERDSSGNTTGQPTVDPGWATPVQVDRDDVRTTVFPWVAAGGAPGRVAVAFYGTTADGDPNSGEFDGAWDVYVNQSLNALDASRTFSQVRATTHPFHYDSICLNGLGCDLATPQGDRSLADFFAIDANPVSGKLSVVFDRTNKKPDESLGHVATPLVATQIAGPSNGGATLTATRPALRQSTDDPTGDALASYSLTTPGTPVPPTPTNEAAGDFTSAAVGPDAATGGFTVTLKVASLAQAALTKALADTGSQSLLWVWRFTNGYTDSAASAAWSPAGGWTFGFDDYTTGGGACDSAVSGEKCQRTTSRTWASRHSRACLTRDSRLADTGIPQWRESGVCRLIMILEARADFGEDNKRRLWPTASSFLRDGIEMRVGQYEKHPIRSCDIGMDWGTHLHLSGQLALFAGAEDEQFAVFAAQVNVAVGPQG